MSKSLTSKGAKHAASDSCIPHLSSFQNECNPWDAGMMGLGHPVVACSLLIRYFLQRACHSKVANSVCSDYVFVISNTSYMPMTQKFRSPAKLLPRSSGPLDPTSYSAASLDVCWLPKSRPRESAHLHCAILHPDQESGTHAWPYPFLLLSVVIERKASSTRSLHSGSSHSFVVPSSLGDTIWGLQGWHIFIWFL